MAISRRFIEMVGPILEKSMTLIVPLLSESEKVLFPVRRSLSGELAREILGSVVE